MKKGAKYTGFMHVIGVLKAHTDCGGDIIILAPVRKLHSHTVLASTKPKPLERYMMLRTSVCYALARAISRKTPAIISCDIQALGAPDHECSASVP